MDDLESILPGLAMVAGAVAVLGGLFVAWIRVEGRLEPRRRAEIRETAARSFPGEAVLAWLRSGGDEDPDWNTGLGVTEAGVIVCERRQGVAIATEKRWCVQRRRWTAVKPVVASRWSGSELSLWVAGYQGEGDVPAFLNAAQPYLDDPSGRLAWLDAQRSGVTALYASIGIASPPPLRHVLHGGVGPTGEPPKPAMLAITDVGVVIVDEGRPRFWRSSAVNLRLVPWDRRPTASVADGIVPSIGVAWVNEHFRLWYCVLGDPRAFVHAVTLRGYD